MVNMEELYSIGWAAVGLLVWGVHWVHWNKLEKLMAVTDHLAFHHWEKFKILHNGSKQHTYLTVSHQTENYVEKEKFILRTSQKMVLLVLKSNTQCA